MEASVLAQDLRVAWHRAHAIDLRPFERQPSFDSAKQVVPLIQDVLEVGANAFSNIYQHYQPRGQDVADMSYMARREVLGQRERLEQVLVNLCFNARDAMPSGGSLALRGYADDHWVTIEIVDSGTGMDESTRRRVFEAFFTTKPAGVGTGLGLWIVNALVDAVSGKVEIESQVDAGTTVRVRLPLLPFFDIPVAAENTGGPRGAGQRLCLAVADDTVNKAMARLLGGVGYVVVAAEGPHDVLIADVSLSTEEMVARASAGGRLLVLGGDGPEPSATLRVERIAEPVRGKAVLEALERLFTTAD